MYEYNAVQESRANVGIVLTKQNTSTSMSFMFWTKCCTWWHLFQFSSCNSTGKPRTMILLIARKGAIMYYLQLVVKYSLTARISSSRPIDQRIRFWSSLTGWEASVLGLNLHWPLKSKEQPRIRHIPFHMFILTDMETLGSSPISRFEQILPDKPSSNHLNSRS
jgi:hypothetical protein